MSKFYSRSDVRQQNSERRLRQASWERDGFSRWQLAGFAFGSILLSIFVLFPLIRLWLDNV